MIRYIALALLLICGSASAQLVGSSTGPGAPAATQTTITADPGHGSISTSSFTLLGLAAPITPNSTGNIKIDIAGTLYAPAGTAAGIGLFYKIYYGTGTAPSNGAGVASNCGTTSCTAVGVQYQRENGATITAADMFQPMAATAVVTGLSVGTAYWVDIAVEAITTAGDQALSNASVAITEQ